MKPEQKSVLKLGIQVFSEFFPLSLFIADINLVVGNENVFLSHIYIYVYIYHEMCNLTYLNIVYLFEIG